MARVKLSAEQRQELKRLKKAGLYSGDLRKPTRYAKSLTKKYKDFLSGDMQVVATKSSTAARKIQPDRAHRKGKRVLVYVEKGGKASYLPSQNAIRIRERSGAVYRMGGDTTGKVVYFSQGDGHYFRLGSGREVQERLETYKPKQREYIEQHLVTLEFDDEFTSLSDIGG